MPEKLQHNFDTASGSWQQAAGKVGEFWCALMHSSTMWPIDGQYECRTCGRHYPVPWAADDSRPARNGPAVRVPALRSALLPLVIAMVALSAVPLRAAEERVVEAASPAGMAFARYLAGTEQVNPWSLESVEIDAALPKLAKQGRMRAIRRLLPFGKPEYQVLEIAGDRTVRQQVIVRYLTAEARAATIPAAAVAVTPANYKFRYKGQVEAGGSVAYIFLITPRQKREGLIRGELWIDGETGAAVRQSGYMVKRPSIFVKRIDVTRETALHEGVAEMRVTHLSIDTRLVGRATLTIEERPYSAAGRAPALGIAEE